MTSPITITLVDPDNARSFPSTTHAGRVCFAVPAGQRFAVRSNSSHTSVGMRLEWIVAVDGRDTLTNKSASQQLEGMVASLTYTCRGFRTGDDEVREFVCANLGDGATTTERNGTVGSAGLVAVAAFGERRNQEREVFLNPPVQHTNSGGYKLGGPTRSGGTTRGGDGPATRGAVLCSASAGPTAGAAADAAILDRVGRTSWTRGSRVGATVVEYDTPEGWALRGVSFEPAAPLPERNPWPGDVPASRHCDPQTL